MYARLEESVAISSNLGTISILTTAAFESESFDVTYAMLYSDLVEPIYAEELNVKRDAAKQLLVAIHEMKSAVQEAAAWKGGMASGELVAIHPAGLYRSNR